MCLWSASGTPAVKNRLSFLHRYRKSISYVVANRKKKRAQGYVETGLRSRRILDEDLAPRIVKKKFFGMLCPTYSFRMRQAA